jgi:hypothetical protein
VIELDTAKPPEILDDMHFYLNDDHTCTPCDLITWENQFEEMSRAGTLHVGKDDINGKFISTAWLGNNHNFYSGEPLLFETMVFNDDSLIEDYFDRYTTWDEAVEGHKKAVQWVLDGCKDEMA